MHEGLVFDRAGLRQIGFVGWVTASEAENAEVPKSPGVYVVMHRGGDQPKFLARSPAGWFKGKDPTLPVDELRARWIPDATVVYIGKANALHTRLEQYRRHGTGVPIGHWGGRAIWQLADSSTLHFAWCEVDADPEDVESSLISRFQDRYGSLPFANRKRGRTPKT